jgi:uncharacterized membrane protein
MTQTVQVIASAFWLVFSLAMIVIFIRRKRAGRWKRPRTFLLAMTLFGLAAVLSATTLVLRQFGL